MTQETGVQKYQLDNGEEIKLSPAIVKQYLVSGEGKVTDQELMMFMALCKFQKLNPFLREAYIIKYGSSPATIVTGKEAFLKRAVSHPKYQGHRVGITVWDEKEGKEAWAEVYVEGYLYPVRIEVDFEEYKGKKKDGSVTEMWKTKGRTMLKKVALVQALREAFPKEMGSMYSEDEMSIVQDEGRSATTIEVKTSEATENLKKKLKEKKGDKKKEAKPNDPKTNEAKPSTECPDCGAPDGDKHSEGCPSLIVDAEFKEGAAPPENLDDMPGQDWDADGVDKKTGEVKEEKPGGKE